MEHTSSDSEIESPDFSRLHSKSKQSLRTSLGEGTSRGTEQKEKRHAKRPKIDSEKKKNPKAHGTAKTHSTPLRSPPEILFQTTETSGPAVADSESTRAILYSLIKAVSNLEAKFKSETKTIKDLCMSILQTLSGPGEERSTRFPLTSLEEFRRLEDDIRERPEYYKKIFRQFQPSSLNYAHSGLANIFSDELLKKMNLKGNYKVKVALEGSEILRILEQAWEFRSHATFISSIREQVRRAHARYTSSARRLKEKHPRKARIRTFSTSSSTSDSSSKDSSSKDSSSKDASSKRKSGGPDGF